VLSVTYSGAHPEQIFAVINFVGGWVGDGCVTAKTINEILFEQGARFKRPTLGFTAGTIHSTRSRIAERILQLSRKLADKAHSWNLMCPAVMAMMSSATRNCGQPRSGTTSTRLLRMASKSRQRRDSIGSQPALPVSLTLRPKPLGFRPTDAA